MSTTIVTALYNINREKKLDGRPFKEYLDYFRHVLAIDAPMVVFVPQSVENYVRQHRQDKKTQIIVREFADLSAYRYRSRISKAIKTMKVTGDRTKLPEFMGPDYDIVIFSKLDFLQEAADTNTFDSEYFIWLDAGTYRHPAPFSGPWPDKYKIKLLGESFMMPAHISQINRDLTELPSYIKNNYPFIYAYTMGGKREAITKIRSDFWNLVEECLEQGAIGTEQTLLQILAIRKPANFFLWDVKNYPQYGIPTNFRMTPYELAQGTLMSYNYPKEPRLQLITVMSREVTNYQKWQVSAERMGYDYIIMGRDKKWDGWKTKMSGMRDGLLVSDKPYAVLTDATDVFFAGCATELLEQFIEMNIDTVVGGEKYMYYRDGNFSQKDVKEFFDGIKKSDQAYPNGGFMMGKRDALIKLMEHNLQHKDDQAACMEGMFTGSIDLHIDYETKVMANLPNYAPFDYSHNMVFDEERCRYRNKITGNYPCVFHFPGHNDSVMDDFYHHIFSDSEMMNTKVIVPASAVWTVLGIFIAFVILLLVWIALNWR